MRVNLETKNLLLERLPEGIQVVRVNRLEVLNALNGATLRELRDVLLGVSKDDSVRVVILTGAGEKSFVAGADIMEMKEKSSSEAVQFSQLGHEVTKLLELMPKPTIAAVNGFALGGGTELAIACDFIYASENAVFGQPEVALGVIPGFGGIVRLAKFVGYPVAKELIFSGRRVKAEEALRLGLANQVFPTEKFWMEVIKMAEMISKQSSTAVRQAKKLLNEFSEVSGLNYKLDSEAQAFGSLFSTSDQREGMSAFVEKRRPKFEGITT